MCELESAGGEMAGLLPSPSSRFLLPLPPAALGRVKGNWQGGGVGINSPEGTPRRAIPGALGELWPH